MTVENDNNTIYVLEIFDKNNSSQHTREVFTFDNHEEALLWVCKSDQHKNALYKGEYHDIRNYLFDPYSYISKVTEQEIEGAVPVSALREILNLNED